MQATSVTESKYTCPIVLNRSHMAYLPAVILTVGIAILSLTESTHMPSVSLNDKLLHGAMYALLAVTWALPLRKLSTFNFHLSTYIIIGTTAYGALMEILQRFCTLTRSGEMADLLADFIGALIGVGIIMLSKWLHEQINGTW